MVTSICSVVFGFLTVAASWVLLLYLGKQKPFFTPPPGFLVFAVLYGILFSILGGYIAGAIAIHRKRRHAAVVSALIALCAFVSLVARMRRDGGSVWMELALILMAPSAFLGGVIRRSLSLRRGRV